MALERIADTQDRIAGSLENISVDTADINKSIEKKEDKTDYSRLAQAIGSATIMPLSHLQQHWNMPANTTMPPQPVNYGKVRIESVTMEGQPFEPEKPVEDKVFPKTWIEKAMGKK